VLPAIFTANQLVHEKTAALAAADGERILLRAGGAGEPSCDRADEIEKQDRHDEDPEERLALAQHVRDVFPRDEQRRFTGSKLGHLRT
jgi:hypothetical protein